MGKKSQYDLIMIQSPIELSLGLSLCTSFYISMFTKWRSSKTKRGYQATYISSVATKKNQSSAATLVIGHGRKILTEMVSENGGGSIYIYRGGSYNRGTPKSSLLVGFSHINQLFLSIPIYGNHHIYVYIYMYICIYIYIARKIPTSQIRDYVIM